MIKTFLFLTIFALILFFPFLGEKEFQGEEGRRVLIALNMLETKEFLLPKLFNEPYFNKPPLFNWGLAFFFKIMGSYSEFTARAFSALSILITALFLTFIWIRMVNFYEKKASFTLYLIPGLIFLTTPEVIDKALRAEIDGFYTMLITFALFGWFYFYEIENRKKLAFFWAGFFLGLGILTKTFQALLFFYLAYLPYLLLQKRWKEIYHFSHLLGLLTALLVFLAWALPVSSDIGLSHFLKAWIEEYKSAALAKEMTPLQHIESFTLSALFGFSPWLFFLFLYKNPNFRNLLKSQPIFEKLTLYSICCFALSYLVHFFFFGSRLRYILPSVGGFVFLSSLAIYFLFKTSFFSRKLTIFFTKVLPFFSLFIAIIFLFYFHFIGLEISPYFYIFHTFFLLLNLFIFLQKQSSFKILFYYLVLFIFLMKQMYVIFYYPYHQVKMNYFRKSALEIGMLIKEKRKLYLCKTMPHHLIYYLRYRFKLVEEIYYLKECDNLPAESFVLLQERDFNTVKNKNLKIIPLQIRSKLYYLLYTQGI